MTLLHLNPNVITLRSLLHLRPNVITLRSLLHLRPNVITLRSLLHLRAVITFRSSTGSMFYIRPRLFTGGPDSEGKKL